MGRLKLICTAVLVCGGLVAQDLSNILSGASRQTNRDAKVTGLRFRCVPEDCRVRPLETLVVQVLVDGEIPVKDAEPRKGRLRRSPGPMRVLEDGGGWVSKAFRFQGEDPGGFVDSSDSFFRSVFSKVAGDFIIQDAFLYSAPETPGVYTLENDTEGIKGQVKIQVTPEAPSNRKPEEVNFGPEDHSAEPYRALAEHYAPMLAQETWWQPKSDYPARFDFDNDWIGDNNWENLDKGSSQAYVYYAVMETATHWFVIYNVFHPRDYSDKCVAGSCHENDNEGIILTVEKDGSPFGKLLVMETLAHNNVYSYTNERTIRGGVHDIDGPIELWEGSHPVVFIESGGHGIYGSATVQHSRYNFEKDAFESGTGVTFIYKGVAERPKHAGDRKVGYDLLPILTHWWARAAEEHNQRMFDEFAPYQPFGGRPRMKRARVGQTFLGRREAANKAKPFWGWHDARTLKQNVLAAGQWGLDPAYAVSRNLSFPPHKPFALDYLYNPYLGIGDDAAAPAAGVVVTAGAPQVSSPVSVQTPAPAPGPTLATQGWVEVDAVVDGSVVFHIAPAQVTAEVLSGQPVRDQKVQTSGPLVLGEGIHYALEKSRGRGSARILEYPTAANGNALKVRVDDPKGAADRYVFRIRWKKN